MKGDYQNGKIYKIEPICEHDEEDVYYGSTTQLLCKRMDHHRGCYKIWKAGKFHKTTVYNLFDKYGIDNCKIYLVESFPCKTKEELLSREGHYIKNNKCVNRYIAGRTKAEYFDDNREKLTSYIDNYRKENETKIKHKMKDYYIKNKDAILKQYLTVCKCSCGVSFTKNHKSRHLKSARHKKYEKMERDLDMMNKLHENMQLIRNHRMEMFLSLPSKL